MATDSGDTTPRPRPRPHGTPPAAEQPSPPAPKSTRRGRRAPGRGLARQQQSQQVVAAAGNAVVTAARVGRLLSRTSWRIAKQLPGVSAVEEQAQRLGQALGADLGRLLDVPQNLFGLNPEEQRAVALIHHAGADAEPLRSAMTELLERSGDRDGSRSQEYLFGTIVSQLVPDEARILATLAGGGLFAAVDIVGRNSARVELANASTVGAAAGVSLLANTGTYLTRLAGFGLIEFPAPPDDLDSQFDALREDAAVQHAKANLDKARTVRKAVTLSPLGQRFWAACAPSADRVARAAY